MRLRKLFGRCTNARTRRAIALAFLLSPPVAGMGDAAETESGEGERAAQFLAYTEPYQIITVSASEPGVIEEVRVKEGDRVKAGDVLARLDIATLEAELDIAKAEAGLETTRRERLEELNRQNRASPDELTKARTDETVRRAQIRRIEAQIENRTLRTPVDGVVTEIKRDPSESVSAANPHVATVVQIDRLAVNLFIDPARANRLRRDGKVRLTFGDGSEANGSVEFVSPVVDPASGTVRVKVVLPNEAGKLMSGVLCNGLRE